MSVKLTEGYKKLTKAECPEEVFGPDPDKVRSEYRAWCGMVHPNAYLKKEDKVLAEKAFLILSKFLEEANGKISRKTYGDKKQTPNLVIRYQDFFYEVFGTFAEGDLATIYNAISNEGNKVLLKVVRSAENNDLANTEAQTLNYIHLGKTGALSAAKHIPKLLRTFELTQSRVTKRVNVFAFEPGFFTLEEVIRAYPKGIDGKTAAWMLNRLLGALITASQAGIVHGAITPANFLIHPEKHDGKLIDWCFCAKIGGEVKAISPDYAMSYAPEIINHAPVSAATDLYMAVKTIIAALGDNFNSLPRPFLGLLRFASLEGQASRAQDPYEFYMDLKKALIESYGEPKFHPFKMP